MSRALLDTSVVIALAQRQPIERPDVAAISAVTLCELHHGVLIADEARRPERLAALAIAERSFRAIPVDQRIAPTYGRLIAAARRSGASRPRTADALIAATALAHGLPVYTRDRDFERLDEVEVVLV